MLARFPGRKSAGIAYAEVVLAYSRGGRTLPFEVEVGILSHRFRTAFKFGIVVEFRLESVLEQELVVAVCGLGDYLTGSEGLIEPCHEIAGEARTSIALVADAAGIGDVSFYLVRFGDDTEIILVFTSGIVYHKSCFCGLGIGETQYSGGRYSGEFGLDRAFFQLHAVVIWLGYFLVVRIAGSPLVGPDLVFVHRGSQGKGAVFRHCGAVGIVAGPEPLYLRLVREIAPVRPRSLGGKLHHSVRKADSGIYEASRFFGARKSGLSVPGLGSYAGIHVVHGILLLAIAVVQREDDHSCYEQSHSGSHHPQGFPGSALPFSEQQPGYSAGEYGSSLHYSPAHRGSIGAHLVASHSVEKNAAVPDDPRQEGPEIVLD